MPPPVRRVGAYAKLLANYAADDAIIAAGEAAELLFVRGLAFCATSDSDGYITDAQLTRYVAAGMRDAHKRASKLVAVALWSRTEGGYLVRSWTAVHETTEEKGRKLKADRERKRSASTGEETEIPDGIRAESKPSPTGVQMEGSPDSLSLIHNTTETDTRKRTREIQIAFDEFWLAYPRKVGKPEAAKRFASSVKSGTLPGDIIDGAKRYALSVRGTEEKFIAHPRTWLNQGRWTDEPPAVTARSSKPAWEA